MQLNKTHELSYTDGIDVSTIGTGDPLNALEIVQDFILDYRANTDGISDADQMAYLAFEQDLADDVRKAQKEAEFQAFIDEKVEQIANGTECAMWDSSVTYNCHCLYCRITDGEYDGIEECDRVSNVDENGNCYTLDGQPCEKCIN